ncbi:MAG: metallophosphoesterase [Isosphaeraceae bacterium]
MPIHLMPNRRDFLRLSLAAGPAAALGRLAGADEPGEWYAWLSDTHIAADPAARNRDNVMADNLKAAVADILDQPGLPRAVFIDGDLALNDGQKGDYETLVGLLSPIRDAMVPIHLALGNHDDRDQFRAVLKAEPPADSSIVNKHVSIVNALGFRILMLDSLQRPNFTPGLLGDAQRGWLTRALDAEPARTTVLFVHHNPAKDEGALNDYEALLEIIQPRRRVKAVVFGHTHRWEHEDRDGLHLLNLPAVAYPFAKDQPLGWVRVEPKTGGIGLELRCIGGDKTKDRQKKDLVWRS